MQLPIVLGFLLVLGSWFGMFFRVRRDHPGSPLARYRSYVGPRIVGVRLGRSGFSLVVFYVKHYGMAGWAWMGIAGLALMVYGSVLRSE